MESNLINNLSLLSKELPFGTTLQKLISAEYAPDNWIKIGISQNSHERPESIFFGKLTTFDFEDSDEIGWKANSYAKKVEYLLCIK